MIGPEIQHNFEPTPRWRYLIARALVRSMGWDVRVPPPKDPKMVMVCAPHTSNWDAYMLILAANCYRVRMRFLFKSDLSPALKPILMVFGGIPIDRSGNLGLVQQAARRLREADRMLLVLAPAGTRRKTEGWKSGFYWIAREAEVPLVAGIADYGKKELSFGTRIELTGDVPTDMDRIRAAFEGVTGFRQDRASPIRIKEEEQQEEEEEDDDDGEHTGRAERETGGR